VTFGRGTDPSNDPIVRLDVPQLTVEAYDMRATPATRIVAFSADVSVPLGMTANGNELRPVLGTPAFRNISAAGATLPADQTAALVAWVQATLGPQLAREIAALLPIQLPAVAVPATNGGGTVGSFQLAVLPNGIQGIAEGNARYLGVWANVRYRSATAH
jgi:hypothetical protein